MSPPKISIEQKLKNHVRTEYGCWFFLGSTDRDGYGVFGHGRNKQLRAHRASYEFYKGKIPKGMYVCHSCDIPRCINPDHLFLGNPKDNTHDMIKKGRKADCKGTNHPSAKLNDLDVLLIKEERSLGKSLKEIGNKFGIAFQTVSDICKGKTWKHL